MTADQVTTVDLAQVSLRTEPRNLPFQTPDANTSAIWNERDVLWLGPDEWLVVGDSGTEGSIEGDLRVALNDEHRAIVVVSANRVVFELTDALELLASGCGLDLGPGHWRPGMCAQSLFGQAQVILHQLDALTTRVFVRPSFAGYFLLRLGAASTTDLT